MKKLTEYKKKEIGIKLNSMWNSFRKGLIWGFIIFGIIIILLKLIFLVIWVLEHGL